MSSKCNLLITIASLVFVVALCSTTTYHPTSCNKWYRDCIIKGKLEEHVCKEKQLKCIVEYCNSRAPRTRGRGPYLAGLFRCALKWKLPMEAMNLIEDYADAKW
ncbi:hypothetical protein ScPMuIL_017121 [Solemya velum]